MSCNIKTLIFSYRVYFLTEEDTGIPAIIIEHDRKDKSTVKSTIKYEPECGMVVTNIDISEHAYHTEEVHLSGPRGPEYSLCGAFWNSIYYIMKNHNFASSCNEELEKFVKDKVMPWLNLKEEV